MTSPFYGRPPVPSPLYFYFPYFKPYIFSYYLSYNANSIKIGSYTYDSYWYIQRRHCIILQDSYDGIWLQWQSHRLQWTSNFANNLVSTNPCAIFLSRLSSDKVWNWWWLTASSVWLQKKKVKKIIWIIWCGQNSPCRKGSFNWRRWWCMNVSSFSFSFEVITIIFIHTSFMNSVFCSSNCDIKSWSVPHSFQGVFEKLLVASEVKSFASH